MGQPAGARATAKTGMKASRGKPDRIEQQRRVDLDIGLQRRPAGLERGEGGGDCALDLGGKGKPAAAAAGGEPLERLAQDSARGSP